MSTLKVATIQDTSGNNSSTPAGIASGTAKAWVNFDGTFGTSPFTEANGGIRDSFNVSSVTDNGTGDYTVNITNALSSANYVVTTSYFSSTANANTCRVENSSMTTTAFNIETGAFQDGSGNSNINLECVMCSVFI